jgi:acyl carrier protein
LIIIYSNIKEGNTLSDALFNKIKGIITEQLGVAVDKIVPEASFTDDLGADSLDVVELVMAFEEEFNIEIDDDSAGKIRTVKDVVEYIEKSLN